MATAENLATFEKFAGLAATIEFLGSEKVVVDAFGFAATRLTSSSRDAEPQSIWIAGEEAAQDRRFAHAGGPGKDNQVAGGDAHNCKLQNAKCKMTIAHREFAICILQFG